MEPQRTTELAIQFAAQVSAWWLLPALVVAVVVVRAVMAREMASVSRVNAWGLFLVRALAVLLLVVLAFRPSVVLREILTYVGRVVVLVDDSMSMAATDPGMRPLDALDIARALDAPTQADSDSLHAAAGRLLDAETVLRRFQAYSRGADRGADAFWDRAEADRERILEGLAAVDDRLEAGIGERGDAASARLAAVRNTMDPLFAGAENPGEAAFDRCAEHLIAAATVLAEEQDVRDAAALAADEVELRESIEEQLGRSRLETTRKMLETVRSRDDLAVEIASLVGGERSLLGEQAIAPVDSVPPVDIPRRIRELLEEDNPFPLAGVILVGDGRDWSGRPVDDDLLRASARRRVPVHVAAAGSPEEPIDTAVLGISTAPIAVKGRETRVRVRLKVVDDAPRDLVVRLVGEDGVIAEATAEAADGHEREVEFRFTPERDGWFRYRVVAESRDAEVFPTDNNQGEFVVQVREQPVRVLLLDWKPRWETRFVTTVLRRLSYVDLNAITMVVQPEGELVRGTTAGTWPVDEATLATYDLVIVGDVPPDTLNDGEHEQLRHLVENRGRILCTIGDGRRTPLAELWPEPDDATDLGPSGADAPSGRLLEDLAVTPAGRHHPLTTALPLPVSAPRGQPADILGRGLILALCDDGTRPVISVRAVGSGHTLRIGHPDLWRRLNPVAIDAHADLVVNLVSWAAMGGVERDAAEDAAPLLLERLVYRSSDVLQAWVDPPRAGATVQALRGGDEAVVEAVSDGVDAASALGRVVLRDLPAGVYDFSVDGDEATLPSVHVIDDDPELTWLARDDAFLASLAGGSGGTLREIHELPRLVERVAPTSRVERHERTWRAWTSAVLMALVTCLLALEWVWRKFAGLV